MLRHGVKLAGFCLALVIFTVSLVISIPATALAGTIELYEGNGGQQNLLISYADRDNISVKVSPNDEARSMVLNDVEPLTIITVYDDPDGSEDDDYTSVIVTKKVPHYVLGTFENNMTIDGIRVEHTHNNGLDGKVSRIRVQHIDLPNP